MRHRPVGTSCRQTVEVFERRGPVLLISHDADDGIWQLIGASDPDGATGKVGHLHHAADEDPSLIGVLDLPPRAQRGTRGRRKALDRSPLTADRSPAGVRAGRFRVSEGTVPIHRVNA